MKNVWLLNLYFHLILCEYVNYRLSVMHVGLYIHAKKSIALNYTSNEQSVAFKLILNLGN